MNQINSSNNDCSSFLEKFDIFGIPITIRYNQQEKHQTRFGALVSLAIIIILIYQLYQVVFDVMNYNNYSVIFQENVVAVPKRYDINPQTFTFAFGLQNTSLQQILDEQIYSIDAQYLYTYKQFSEVTNQYEYITETTNFKPEVCTTEHFQVEGATDYFNQLPYKKLYCLPLALNLTLEGQFGSETYKRIHLVIKYCKGDNCRPLSEVQQTLLYCNLQVYYVNQVIQFQDRENPYKSFGQSVFWQSGFSIMKNINIYYRNSYLDSQEGMLQTVTKQHNSLSYSLDREQVVNQVGQQMFDVYINLEKNKESQYYRKYQTLSQGISQLGGFFNFMFFLGCMICYPVSRMILRHKLLNSIFQFQNKESKELQQQKIGLSQFFQHTSQINPLGQNLQTPEKQLNESKILENYQEEQFKSKKNSFGNLFDQNMSKLTDSKVNCDELKYSGLYPKKYSLHSKKNNRFSLDKRPNRQKDDSKTNDDFIPDTIQEESQDKKQVKKTNFSRKESNKLINKIEKQLKPGTFQTNINNIRLKITDIFFSFVNMKFSFLPFVKPTPKQKMIAYSFEKLNNHIDMSQIITKLLEIEKLKQLLLTEDQVKLFEFIPQPQIDLDNFQPENDLLNQNNENHNIGVLHNDKKTIFQKANDAQLAFNTIFNKTLENISSIDKKLLILLDPNVQTIFQQPNRQEFSALQSSMLQSQLKTINPGYESNLQTIFSPKILSLRNQFNFNEIITQNEQEFGHSANTNCDKDSEQLALQ